jgi:hypothetical protein
MRPAPVLVGLGVVAAICVAPLARAADRVEPSTVEAQGSFVHEGLYVRGAIGAGSLSSNETVGGDNVVRSSLRGEGPMGEVSIGGSLMPGVIVAGTLLTYTITTPTVETGGRVTTLDQRENLGILGLTMDWYPFPRGGFHIAGTLGGGLLRGLDGNGYVVARSARYGSAFSVGLGYDWWVARDVSVGILARATGAQLGGAARSADGRAVAADTRLGAASLMLTALYQ